MAHSIFFHNNCSTYRHTYTVRLNALFWSRNASDITIRCLLRAITTSRKEIRASIFYACWARWLGNSILSARFFCLLTSFSERKWRLRAHLTCSVMWALILFIYGTGLLWYKRWWGPGGHWPPSLGFRCQNFGQFHVFWANSYVLGNFAHPNPRFLFVPFFLESNRKVGNKQNKQDFFFWDHLNLDEKNNWFFGQNSSKSLVPPKSFWAPTPTLDWIYDFCVTVVTKDILAAKLGD